MFSGTYSTHKERVGTVTSHFMRKAKTYHLYRFEKDGGFIGIPTDPDDTQLVLYNNEQDKLVRLTIDSSKKGTNRKLLYKKIKFDKVRRWVPFENWNLSTQCLEQVFRHRMAMNRMKKNSLFQDAIEKYRQSLWKPGGYYCRQGWEECQKVMEPSSTC